MPGTFGREVQTAVGVWAFSGGLQRLKKNLCFEGYEL